MPKKILIADDEEEIIELLRCALEPSGYAIVSTTHGARIEPLIRREKPDLLILDVMLPGVDGYSLQQQLALHDETRGIPVIIITALPAARELFEKFEQVRLFVNKPFNPGEITGRVREILGE